MGEQVIRDALQDVLEGNPNPRDARLALAELTALAARLAAAETKCGQYEQLIGEADDELAAVRAERDEAVRQRDGFAANAVNQAEAVRVAEAERDEARQALAFYADRRNYVPAAPPAVEPPEHLMATDAWDGNGPGARARAALAPVVARPEAASPCVLCGQPWEVCDDCAPRPEADAT